MTRWSRSLAGIALIPLLLASASRAGAQSQLLVVSGLGGEQEYSDAFYEWGAAMFDAGLKLGLPRDHIVFLAEDSTRDRQRISGRSTKENILKAIDGFAARGDSGDVVMVMLIGHGSIQGEASLFSMPGADMSAADFAAALDKLHGKKVAFVNGASGSGDFVPVVSGPNRVVVTATKTGFEHNQTMFPRFFIRAYAGDGADQDKDNRVSLLEAFDYARKEVARTYESENRILTEHALLDDNGDRVGSTEPDPRKTDGTLARGIFLSQRLTAGASTSPALVALYKEKQVIEDKIDALRRAKATMPPAEYDKQLEQLLVDLTEKTLEIKKAEGGGGGA